jgi:hypothetical protein
MKLTVLALVGALSLTSQIGFAQGEAQVPVPASTTKNPLTCATQENLVFETSSGFPRVEFFSCDKEKVPVEISAIIDYGRKSDVSLEKFGFVLSKQVAEQFQRLFPKDKFLSPDDKTGRQYLARLKEGLRKKGVSYTQPGKMASRK